MDKSNHTITVPREYLEMLEGFYEANKDSGFNIYGKHVTHLLPYSVNPLSQREDILFLNWNEITDKLYDKIIVVDSDGSEKFRYVVTDGTRMNYKK